MQRDENEIDEEFEMEQMRHWNRSSLIARQISFSQRRVTLGEIILIFLPYFILLIDIFIFFLLRGFKINSLDQSVSPD